MGPGIVKTEIVWRPTWSPGLSRASLARDRRKTFGQPRLVAHDLDALDRTEDQHLGRHLYRLDAAGLPGVALLLPDVHQEDAAPLEQRDRSDRREQGPAQPVCCQVGRVGAGFRHGGPACQSNARTLTLARCANDGERFRAGGRSGALEGDAHTLVSALTAQK